MVVISPIVIMIQVVIEIMSMLANLTVCFAQQHLSHIVVYVILEVTLSEIVATSMKAKWI